MRFLIVDGYSKESQDQFREFGVPLAWEQYRDMLLRVVPDAAFDVWLPSHEGARDLQTGDLKGLTALLWTGCNRTVYHTDDPPVMRMCHACRLAYDLGLAQYGSCWGLQIAVVVAGGEVAPNPRGREMGLGHKIRLTHLGETHPMMEGKPLVYDHFESHDDHVTRLPPGALHLAGNAWSEVQAAVVTMGEGVFWATQYHCEYRPHDVARLIRAREPRLVKQGLFRDHDDLVAYADRLQALAAEPARKDLRWQLGIDDDLLDPEVRQAEFGNFVRSVLGIGLARALGASA